MLLRFKKLDDLRPDKCYVAAAFREVMEAAISAFSGRFDSLYINFTDT
jgi:hypothetical protein